MTLLLTRPRLVTALAALVWVDPLLGCRPEPPAGAAQAQDPAALSPSDDSLALDPPGIWWNQPELVKDLNLDDEQRRRMDAALTACRRQLQELRAARTGEKLRAFAQALGQGNREGAQEAAQQIALDRTKPQLLILLLMIDVAQMLTPEQRQTISEKYARIWRRPWLRSMRLGGDAGGQEP